MIPPKFTPAILEEVGRALGPSLLDLTNANPQSRVPNSEFRSLQGIYYRIFFIIFKFIKNFLGLRNALKNEINRGLSRARVNKVTSLEYLSLITSGY
jgi:hypothetical protein